jgi:hypothetical protein
MFRAVYEDTGSFHPAHARKPALRKDCIRYMDAFQILSAARVWSQVGPTPLQTSEIESYLNLLGLKNTHTRLKYLRLIRGLDEVEVTYLLSKMKK